MNDPGLLRGFGSAYEEYMTRGLGSRGIEIWEKTKRGEFSHQTLLQGMRQSQEALAKFSKRADFSETKDVQLSMERDAHLYDVLAWRLYMFGKPNHFAVRPGMSGEFAKRLRNDTTYHKERDRQMIAMGEWGCQYELNVFRPVLLKCPNPQCRHLAIKRMHKRLKHQMKREWDVEIRSKWAY